MHSTVVSTKATMPQKLKKNMFFNSKAEFGKTAERGIVEPSHNRYYHAGENFN